MPSEFFEIKPQRAVKLEEFRGAIIPKDTPQNARDILQQRGIRDVYEYATPEERASLMQRFGKEMFVAAPVGTGLLEVKQEKKPKK
jgi:cation transport ATPase